MKPYKTLGFLLLLGLLIPIPTTNGVPDGNPPTETCHGDLAATADIEYGGFGNGFTTGQSSHATDTAGNFYYLMAERIKTGTFTNDHRSFVRRVSPTCAILDYDFCDTTLCPHDATDSQTFGNHILIDNGGRLVGAYTYHHTGTDKHFIESFDVSDSLNPLHRSFDFGALTPAWSGNSAITNVRNGTNDVDYIIANENAARIARVNSNLTMTKWIVAGSSGMRGIFCCSADETKFFVVRNTGASDVIEARLVSTGAISNAAVGYGSTRITTLNDRAPELGYVDNTRLFTTLTFLSTAVEQTQRRHTYTTASLATVQTTLAFSSIHDGAYRSTFANANVLDGADNLLTCGSYTSTGSKAMMAYYGTTDMRWNVTFPTLSNSDSFACQITTSGQIGLALRYDGAFNNNVRFYRFTGGDATGITFPRFPVTYSTPEVVLPANPFNDAKDFFIESWNIPESAGNWLFTIGAIGICAFGFAQKNVLITAIGALLGVGLAIAFGWAPLWLLLAIIFLIVAVAGFRLFNQGDEE